MLAELDKDGSNAGLLADLLKLCTIVQDPDQDRLRDKSDDLYVQPLNVWPIRLLSVIEAHDKLTRCALFEYLDMVIVAFHCNRSTINSRKSSFIELGPDKARGVLTAGLHRWRHIHERLRHVIRSVTLGDDAKRLILTGSKNVSLSPLFLL